MRDDAVLLQVKSGEAAPAELQQEQEKLDQFSSQLEGLQTNYSRVKDQAAALLQRIAGTGSPSSTGSADAGSRSGTTGSAGGIGAVQSAVYAGLKFSGLAMRIAQDVVTSVKDDANKILKVGMLQVLGFAARFAPWDFACECPCRGAIT
jgi:hypothetical protein